MQFEQHILTWNNFRKYLFEDGGMSSTLNKGTGTDSYRVTTYTGDKKNACGCNSSGLALKQHNSTLRHTSCTCHAKFKLRMDHEQSSLSVIPTDDTSPPLQQKSVSLDVAETSAFKKYALEVDTLLEQGKTRIYSFAVVGIYQKADVCIALFRKLYVLMAPMRQTMKADHC
jgi:hypothetical protein